MTTRRQFIAGLLATAAAPALPKISIDIERVPLRGPIRHFGLMDETLYMSQGLNIDSSYCAVYTPWFAPAGLERGVIKNLAGIAHNYRLVDMEVGVGDKRFYVSDQSNLGHDEESELNSDEEKA